MGTNKLILYACGASGHIFSINFDTLKKKYYKGHLRDVWNVELIENDHCMLSCAEDHDVILWGTVD